MNTKSMYFNGVDYAPHRVRLHHKIIQSKIQDTSSSAPPLAMLLAGGSCCGKSTIVERYLLEWEREDIFPVIIDCDDIKKNIPEYGMYLAIKPVKAADWVHDESSDISSTLLHLAISEKRDIVYDGTMKNKEKYEGIIHSLKENGYRILAVIVDVPLEVALERRVVRNKIDGRHVSKDTVYDTHKGVSQTIPVLCELFDEYVFWDNAEYGGEGSIFAYKLFNDDGILEEAILDDARYLSFISKALL